jgi:hypothetical protein
MKIETDIECCVCKSSTVIPQKYTHCQNNHKICKECFLSVLQICYCKNKRGELVYKCPLCRNEYRYSNTEIHEVLMDLVSDNTMCFHVHKLCEYNEIKTKKCKFENCGCRTNIVDIITQEDLDLSIKSIIKAASNYPSKLRSPRLMKAKINHE